MHRHDTLDTRSEYEEALNRIRNLQQALALAVFQSGEWSRDSLRLSQQIDHYVVLVQRYWDGHPENTPSRVCVSDGTRRANAAW